MKAAFFFPLRFFLAMPLTVAHAFPKLHDAVPLGVKVG
jgi:hypothetical protein